MRVLIVFPKRLLKRISLTFSGCHQAIAEVQGILVPPTEEGGKFMLILSDGIQLEVLFRDSRLKSVLLHLTLREFYVKLIYLHLVVRDSCIQ